MDGLSQLKEQQGSVAISFKAIILEARTLLCLDFNIENLNFQWKK